DAMDRIPIVLGTFEEFLLGRDAGIVDENIDLAEARYRRLDHAGDLGGLRHVELQSADIPALSFQFLSKRLDRLAVPVAGEYPRALFREAAHHGGTKSAGSAGDDRRFSFETHAHSPSVSALDGG